EAYRGQNANMHTCEAMLAAYEATGERRYLDRAREVAHALTVRLAAETDGLLWEHYTQLTDEKGTPLTDARVEIKNTNSSEVSEGFMNDETGDYAVAVRMDKESDDDYIMLVKKENYSFTSKYIDPEELETNDPVDVDMEVKPIEKGQAVKINDIYFDFASDNFDDKSLIVLDNFIDFLNENTSIEFEIRGHTDSIGSASTNMNLSERRAKAVYNYLLNNGIDKSRMEYKGFGETKPVASNKTEEGRAKNRRTEFYIVNY
ncbi:MAG: OmpA family protein, partial [Bacteroidales bacterium]